MWDVGEEDVGFGRRGFGMWDLGEEDVGCGRRRCGIWDVRGVRI
jgi:hypothetical protein